MALRLFQSWALAFKPKTELSFFVDVYNELKNSGTLLDLCLRTRADFRRGLPSPTYGNILSSPRYVNRPGMGGLRRLYAM